MPQTNSEYVIIMAFPQLKIYKSLKRPVVTYGCEAWTLTNRDELHLRIFERRILRKIFGSGQNEDGSWRIRMNYELMNHKVFIVCVCFLFICYLNF
jgi:hypothetical protein